jgi:hypothetical protein
MSETDSAFGAAGSRCDGLTAVRLLAGLVCDRPPHARAGAAEPVSVRQGHPRATRVLGPAVTPAGSPPGRTQAHGSRGLGVAFRGASSARPHLDVFRGGSAPITRKPQGACSRDSQVAIGLVLDPEGFPKAHEVTVWPPDLFADWVRSPPTFSSMSGSPRSPSGPS